MAGTGASDILPYTISFFVNGEWVAEPRAVLPIKKSRQLNEALDVGEFVIMATPNAEPLPPFTKMQIVEGGGDTPTKTTYWYASSQVEMCKKTAPYLYKHYVSFVEPTKILETITTGGELLTQPTTGAKKSMYDYFNTLLAVNPLRTANETQAITIDTSLTAYLQSIEAREFTTNHNTLFEALVEGAQYIHAYPRMTDFTTLSFDFFGEVENFLQNDDSYFTWAKAQNPNEYCTDLEVQASNVLDTEKSMWYPSVPGVNLGVTVRSETVDLTTSTMELILPFGIYEVKQILVWGFKLQLKTGGITPQTRILQDCTNENNAFVLPADRILEKSQYQILTNYGYDESTQSAHLFYERYDNKIQGFGQQGYGGILSGTFALAWANTIIQEYNSNVVSGDLANNISVPFYQLQYKIEYVPVSNPRLRQVYSGSDRPQIATSFDNQSQNVVDIKALGENLKGKVARFGNKTIEKSSVYTNVNDIPTIGSAQVVNGDLYILETQNEEFYNTFYKVTNVFTKDFSRLSAYIGLNQRRREFELPSDMVVERKLYRPEYFCAGLSPFTTTNPSISYNNAALLLRNAFKSLHPTWTTSGNLCTSSFVVNFDSRGDTIAAFLLPTSAKRTGNSLLFEFGFPGNLSAGKQIEGQWTDTEKSASLNIPYCDEDGEIATMQVQIAVNVQSALNGGVRLNPDTLPYWTSADQASNTAARYGFAQFPKSKAWVVKKDARNSLACNYQLHYIGLDGLVIGEGLIKYAALINENAPSSLGLFLFSTPLNKLQNDYIDTSKVVEQVATYSLTFDSTNADYNKYDLSFTPSENALAWGILTDKAELLIGGNTTLTAGQQFSASIYFAATAQRP